MHPHGLLGARRDAVVRSASACSPAILALVLTLAVYACGRLLPAPADPLDVVAGHRRLGRRHRRLLPAARPGRRLRRDRAICSRGNYVIGRRLVPLIVVKCWIWSTRWARAPRAACWRRCSSWAGRSGRWSRYFLPGGDHAAVAAGEHGRRHGRHHALAPDRHRLRPGTDARHQRAAGAADRLGRSRTASRCW